MPMVRSARRQLNSDISGPSANMMSPLHATSPSTVASAEAVPIERRNWVSSTSSRKRVARFDLAFEAHIVDPCEKGDAPFVLIHRAKRDTACLRQGFDDQDPGHDRVLRKMTLEKMLVDGDILDAHSALADFELDDSIDQQERKAMRKNFLNRDRIEDCWLNIARTMRRRFLASSGARERVDGDELFAVGTDADHRNGRTAQFANPGRYRPERLPGAPHPCEST